MEEERIYTFDREFHEIVSNKDVLRRTTEKFLNNLIDDITLGIIFDTHRKFKTKSFNLDRDEFSSTLDPVPSNMEMFVQTNAKKIIECMCPKCGKEVEAVGFALHLETCMGLRRSSLRNVNTRTSNNNTKEKVNQVYTGLPSDDEDDWCSFDKRRKKKYRNGSRKGKGTPKKSSEPDLIESVNVDIEGDDESDLTNLRELLQDNSNGSSPADSVSTSNSSSSSKKKEKSKSKKK